VMFASSVGDNIRFGRPDASDAEVARAAEHANAAGFIAALPQGFEAQVRPRSGLALHHGITVLNAPGTIDSATLVTLLGAGGLMVVAHQTRKDFSFLRAILMWGGIVALLAIVGGAIFGFQLGTWFSVAMIGFAGVAALRRRRHPKT